ncbi:uncharacterized protein LOC129570734 [Sitodiplosis mosellana]|uniref:uncharacterized protein LOC129570734 n=1 Tax=Sitodiplosis mosellana TaxID=263140 RepID=UPI002443B210|nr:uncharacterized protein LOC129570734 [Sitodiplosis mosellana]
MDTPNDSDGSPTTAVPTKVFRFTLPSVPSDDRNANLFGSVSEAQNLRQMEQLCGMFRSALLQVDETRPLNLRCSMCISQLHRTYFRNVEELITHFQNKHHMKAIFVSE